MYHNHTIYTADGSHLFVNPVGSISVSSLHVDSAYCVPKLSMNFLSIGQLCEVGYEVHFYNTDCDVQDLLTGQLIGTGHKIGRFFELSYL